MLPKTAMRVKNFNFLGKICGIFCNSGKEVLSVGKSFKGRACCEPSLKGLSCKPFDEQERKTPTIIKILPYPVKPNSQNKIYKTVETQINFDLLLSGHFMVA